MDQETLDKIAKLREQRDGVNAQIEALKHEARDLSRQIGAMEGEPGARRSAETGFSIKPAS